MKLSFLEFFLIILLLITGCGNESTSTESETSLEVALSGYVKNQSGEGEADVVVEMKQLQLIDTTDDDGYYELEKKKLPDNFNNRDTISYSRADTLYQTITITEMIDTLPDVILFRHDISCDLTKASSAIDSVEAVFLLGDSSSTPFSITPLVYYNESKSLSGYSFLNHDILDTSRIFMYVRLLDHDGFILARSKFVEIFSITGAIKVPDFSPDNLQLTISANKSHSIYPGDTLVLTLSHSADVKEWIDSLFWDIGQTGNYTTGTAQYLLPITENMKTKEYVDAQAKLITGEIVRVRNFNFLVSKPDSIVYSEDLTERIDLSWTFTSVNNEPTTVMFDSTHLQSAKYSVKLDTEAGFDVGLIFPLRPVKISATEQDSLWFTLYTENSSPTGFQGENPIIRIVTSTGTANYTPLVDLCNAARDTWLPFVLPFSESHSWKRADSATVDFNDIRRIEFHVDTWDYGYKLWLDDVRIVPGQ